MTKYDLSAFSYGSELEWGDIDRRLVIPSELGEWEYSETDIINRKPPYKYVSADPLGKEPPFGGEINTKPDKSWEDQIDRIMAIYDFFVANGNVPVESNVSHTHIHVYVPGLKEDLSALKQLVRYIKRWQSVVVKQCGKYVDMSDMVPGAKAYLKYDGGRLMPDWMCDNIINLATDFPSFIKLHAAGKDGVSMGRPFRYAINTYCMKHTGTIEFRFFRSTVNGDHFVNMFHFVEQFMDAALNTNYPVDAIFKDYYYDFPDMVYIKEEFLGWQATRYDKSRGTKVRKFYDI